MSKLKTFEHLHSKPKTRREFLATGLIPFSSALFLPSWLKMFSKAGLAEAQELVCKSAAASDMCAFVGIKLSGGMAMSANFVPHDAGLQLLPSYSRVGLGLGSRLQLDYEFANRAPFYASSQLLAGIRQTAQTIVTDTLAKSNFAGVCVRSQDDSAGNKFWITGLVAKSGLAGKILPGLGRIGTETGVGATYAYLRPEAPLIVGRYEDLTGALGVSGALGTLSQAQKSEMFKTVHGLTTSQAAALNKMTGGEVLSRLIQCSNKDNTTLISSNGNLNTDPLSNTQFSTIWNINNNSNRAGQDFVFASMVYNALNGNAGTVSLEMGGFDYHDGTRTNGDQRDLGAGQVIGRVLQSAALLGKKVFICVTSDGSVTSPESNDAGAPWTSDRGIGGSAYMIGYDPAGAHSLKSFQVGHFTAAGQAADDNFLTGGSVEHAAGAMFANYLAFNKKLGMIETYLPRVFTTDQVDQVVVYS